MYSSPVRRARDGRDSRRQPAGSHRRRRLRSCEMHNGEADGLTWQEDDARYGRFNIVEEPSCPFAPGAESWDDVMARVRRRLEEWQREMSVTQSESSPTRDLSSHPQLDG